MSPTIDRNYSSRPANRRSKVRFALIDENDGFFVSRLKRSANPLIVRELRGWRGRAIPLEGKRVFDLIGDLHSKRFRVVDRPSN